VVELQLQICVWCHCPINPVADCGHIEHRTHKDCCADVNAEILIHAYERFHL